MHPVEPPRYHPETLTAGIVHIGPGNFHRAHQAMYLDRLMSAGLARDWAICGVGLLPPDRALGAALRAQQMRYTLVERDPDGAVRARTIASIVEHRYAPDEVPAVLERLADPRTRIVSLTITEGGYLVDDVTGEFDLEHPAVRADLAPGAVPTTAFGLVVEGLRLRRERGVPPFTVLSCDNRQGNGEVAARAFTAFAGARDAGLGAWVAEQVAFPSSMVDRITPATGPAERAFVAETFGVQDAVAVVSEGFAQWVLEDRFPLGRPPLERAGVQIVPDVAPYERMKLRLLNAGHQVLAHWGRLLGHELAHEAVGDPAVEVLAGRYLAEEAEPTLDGLVGVDLAGYRASLLARFGNPYVRDTLHRLATDGADRIGAFLLPVVRDRLAAGEPVRLCAAIAAGWAVCVLDGGVAPAPDRQAEVLAAAVVRAAGDPAAFLRERALFGDLGGDPRFAEPFLRTVAAVRAQGPRRALAGVLAG